MRIEGVEMPPDFVQTAAKLISWTRHVQEWDMNHLTGLVDGVREILM